MPSNTSFATATVITTFPYDVTQTDINSGGVNATVFYKLTAPTGAVVLGAWCFSGHVGSGYRPTTYLYEGPSHVAIPAYDPINAIHKPFQFSVTPGTDYYFEIRKNLDDAVANTVRVQVEVFAATGTPAAGDILVNDDSPGFPLAVLSHTTANRVVRFVNGIAAGESGDILDDGTMAFDDFQTTQVRLYAPDFTSIGIADYASATAHIRACRPLEKFYVAFEKNPPTVRTVNPDASYGATTWTLTGMTSCLGFAPSNDGAVFYVTAHAAASAIRVYDAVGLAFLPDLMAGIVGNTITDLLVLRDGTIVAIFETSAGVVLVRRLSAAGVVLQTYALGTNARPGGTFARLAFALADPDSFWVWMHGTNGVSQFQEMDVATGAVLTARTFTEYETGILQATETATPAARFGPSFSCPFVIYRGPEGTPPGGPGEPPGGPGGPGEPPNGPDSPPAVAPSYHLDARYIRRLRRAPHVNQENLRVFYRKFELDLERGQGLPSGQGEDPMVLLRLSRDGGQTWGEEMRMGAGKLGEYTQRVMARRLGHGRDVVFEVVVSDPIAWSLVQAWLDLDPGAH